VFKMEVSFVNFHITECKHLPQNIIKMRFSSTLLFLLLYSLSIKAQSISLKIDDMASGQRYEAYLLATNNIRAVIENESCDSFFLSTNNGTIKRLPESKCDYAFRPEKFKFATIFFHKTIGNDTIIFKEIKVKVKPWPFKPLLGSHLGKITAHYILEKEEFLKKHISIASHNTGLSAFCKINSFSIMVMRQNELVYEKKFKKYNREIATSISNDLKLLKPWDIVHIKK